MDICQSRHCICTLHTRSDFMYLPVTSRNWDACADKADRRSKIAMTTTSNRRRRKEIERDNVWDELSMLMYENRLDAFSALVEKGVSNKMKRENQPEIEYSKLQDDAGNNLLNLSAFWGKTEFCEYLLKQNFDCDAKNHVGMNALDIAVQWGHTEVAQVLVQFKGETGLVGQLAELTKKCEGLESDLKQALEERDHEMAEKLKFKKSLSTVLQDLETRTTERDIALSEAEKHKETAANLNSSLAMAHAKIEQLEEFLQTTRESNYRLKRECRELKERCKSAYKDNSELRVTVMTLNSWIRKLKKTAQCLSLDRLISLERAKKAQLEKQLSERLAEKKIDRAQQKADKLENIERRCKLLEKKIAKRDTTCALDALNRLCPPSVMTNALRGLVEVGKFKHHKTQSMQDIPSSTYTRDSNLHDRDMQASYSRALGGASVPFEMLMVSPSGCGMSMVRVVNCECDVSGHEEKLTVRYKTRSWEVEEPKMRGDTSQLPEAVSEFYEINEILGSVIVRRHTNYNEEGVLNDNTLEDKLGGKTLPALFSCPRPFSASATNRLSHRQRRPLTAGRKK